MGIREYDQIATQEDVAESRQFARKRMQGETDTLHEESVNELRERLTAAVSEVGQAVQRYVKIAEEHSSAMNKELEMQRMAHAQFQSIMEEFSTIQSVPTMKREY